MAGASRLRSYLIFDPLIWALHGRSGIHFEFQLRFSAIESASCTALRGLWLDCIMTTILLPVTVTGLDENRHFQNLRLRRESRFRAGHSRPVRESAVSVPHCIQERVAVVSDDRLAPETLRQVCIDQQNPTRSIADIRSAVKSLKAGMPLVIFPGGRPHAGRRDQTVSAWSILSGDQGASGCRAHRVDWDLRDCCP